MLNLIQLPYAFRLHPWAVRDTLPLALGKPSALLQMEMGEKWMGLGESGQICPRQANGWLRCGFLH